MTNYATEASTVTALGFGCLVCIGLLTVWLPQRFALVPLLVTTCYIPLGQAFVIGGLNLPLFRLLLLVGLCRVLARKEHVGLTYTTIDRLFTFWVLVTWLVGTLTEPSFQRFINRSGEVYNAAGAYFLFRCWIRSLDNAVAVVRFLAWMIVPLAISMLVEKTTQRNIFSILGGVPEITIEREGRLRCQGAFRHPILAGSYAATLFPLFCGLYLSRLGKRRTAITGGVAAGIVTMASASSGALLAILGGAIGIGTWLMRDRMRWIRRGVIVLLIALALVMNAPVWYIIARVSEVVGGTGWHRSYLIDQAIRHFGEWWLVGSAYTAHWAPSGQVLAVDPNNMDITNHYIAEGLGGGILKLGLFLAIIVRGFKIAGRVARSLAHAGSSGGLFIWSMGATLFGHCVCFISVSYFDQIILMWFWLLAMFAMVEATCLGSVQIPAVAAGPGVLSEA